MSDCAGYRHPKNLGQLLFKDSGQRDEMANSGHSGIVARDNYFQCHDGRAFGEMVEDPERARFDSWVKPGNRREIPPTGINERMNGREEILRSKLNG